MSTLDTTSRFIAQCIKVSGREICGPIPTLTRGAPCLGDPSSCASTAMNLGWLIGLVMSWVYPFAGLVLFFALVAAGYDYVTSSGDPAKIESAWAKITYSVVGLIILIASYLAIRIAGAILGFGSVV